MVRAQIEADLGITRAEIERIRGAYVALLPVDPEARRAELEALKRELHLDDPEPTTPGMKPRRTKKADPLSLHERIAKQSADAPKNEEPMEPLAGPAVLVAAAPAIRGEAGICYRATGRAGVGA